MNNNCTNNAKLWNFIYKLNKINKRKTILTSDERFELCNYINGLPYNKKLLTKFIYK
jgi:hypothetical protein